MATDPSNKPTSNQAAGMAVFGGIGIGLEAYGAYQGYQASKEYNAAQVQNIALEQQMEGLKYRSMNIMTQRSQREAVRNFQRARAISIAQAVGSGQGVGSFAGSGVQGSIAGEQGQTNVNMLGLSQNLQFGQQAYNLQSQISQSKIAMANANMKSQEAGGWASIGKSVLQAAPYAAMFL